MVTWSVIVGTVEPGTTSRLLLNHMDFLKADITLKLDENLNMSIDCKSNPSNTQCGLYPSGKVNLGNGITLQNMSEKKGDAYHCKVKMELPPRYICEVYMPNQKD